MAFDDYTSSYYSTITTWCCFWKTIQHCDDIQRPSDAAEKLFVFSIVRTLKKQAPKKKR